MPIIVMPYTSIKKPSMKHDVFNDLYAAEMWIRDEMEAAGCPIPQSILDRVNNR